MREVPGRERVGREPLVHQRQRRNAAGILQVLVIGADLTGEQHAFVDNRACRHRRHVELLAVRKLERLDGVARGFADDVELALQRVGDGDPGAAADEDLADSRLDALHRMAESLVVAGHIAPAEQHLAFVLDGALDFVFACKARGGLLRQEHHADAVFAHRRQRYVLLGHLLAEELVRDLYEDPRAVAGQRVCAHSATMREVLEDREPLLDDGMALGALDVRHKADATGVMFVGRVVQTLGFGRMSVCHGDPLNFHGARW